MAVKDIFQPKSTNPIDPKTAKEKEEGKETEFQQKAKDAKAEREYLEEQRRIDRIGQPEQQKEPAFAVEGKMKLDIDPQRDAREAKEAAEKEREKAERDKKDRDDKIDKLTAERDKTTQELQDTKLSAVMKEMTGQFNKALETMSDKLEAVKAGADPSALVAQFKVITKMAEEMSSLSPQAGDPKLQLEITKLQMDNARAEREFQFHMQQQSQEFQRQLKKDEDEKYFKQHEATRQGKHDEFMYSMPQMFGGAIARGIIETKGGGETPVASKAEGEVPAAPKAGQRYELPVPVGKEGVTHCPECGTEIGIGPTARTAVCANCNAKIFIKRVGAEEPVAEESGERHREVE